MKFNWILKSHHKMCLDDGLIIRNCRDNDYAILKDEKENYSLFEINCVDGNEEWIRVASSKNFNNFKRKVSDVLGEEV